MVPFRDDDRIRLLRYLELQNSEKVTLNTNINMESQAIFHSNQPL